MRIYVKGIYMKKLSQKQKTIIAVAACIIVLVSVVITVTTVRKRAQKQEYERISMEESRLALSSLSESSTEETSESTSAPTTEEPTTQKPPVTTEKKKDTPKVKAETTTQKNSSKPIPIQTLIYGPIPAPADTGGLYIVGRGAGNLREDPNGGYLLDVWAEIANNEYNNPIFNDTIEGRLAFSVSKFDDTFVLRDVIDVGTLQPGERKKKTVTVHVDENEPYKVYFYTV